jgi:hypothetical protein
MVRAYDQGSLIAQRPQGLGEAWCVPGTRLLADHHLLHGVEHKKHKASLTLVSKPNLDGCEKYFAMSNLEQTMALPTF